MIVLELVTGSLRQIGIIGETQTPSAEQGQAAVTRLNDLMAELDEDQIDLGWNPKSTTADSVALPLGNVEGIKAMLAVKLAGDYGVDPPQSVILSASESYKRLLRQAIQQAMVVTRVYNVPRGNFQGDTARIETDQ